MLQSELEKYFQNYLPCFRSEPQRKLFRTFITGLLSPLERNDHAFLDGLKLPEGVWYFAATNAKEQVFPEYPQMSYPETKRGRPRKHPILSTKPVSVREIAEDSSVPWESVVLAEGAKGPIVAERKYMRCYSCRKDGNRSYVKPGPEIWLYLRKYADGEIKYFVSNAPGSLAVQELDRTATLRWPIEQCFEESKAIWEWDIMNAGVTRAGSVICCL